MRGSLSKALGRTGCIRSTGHEVDDFYELDELDE